MDITTLKNRVLKLDFWLNTWLGKLLIIAVTIQAAIFITSLIIVFPNYIYSAKGDFFNPAAIVDLLINAGFMSFIHPLSMWFFMLFGLNYVINQYLDEQAPYYALVSNWLAFLPIAIYSAIIIPAIFTRKRIIFYLLYTILILVLIVNVAGCVAMPKPTGSM